MDGISCDRCGAPLLVSSNVRYTVAIDVRAAADVMEVSREDLDRDHREELRRLLARLESLSAADAQRQVHCSFRFDLCPACQREYVREPLAPRRARLADAERAAIGAALREAGGDRRQAAGILGVRAGALARRMKRLGM